MEKSIKKVLAFLREGYPLDIPDSLRDLNPASTIFLLFFSKNIPRNTSRLASALCLQRGVDIFLVNAKNMY